jgi:hypothetical protein
MRDPRAALDELVCQQPEIVQRVLDGWKVVEVTPRFKGRKAGLLIVYLQHERSGVVFYNATLKLYVDRKKLELIGI